MLKKIIIIVFFLMISVGFTWQVKLESITGTYAIERENGKTGNGYLVLYSNHSCKWTEEGGFPYKAFGIWEKKQNELILTWEYNKVVDNSKIDSFYNNEVKGIKLKICNEDFQPIENIQVSINADEMVSKTTNKKGRVEFLEEDFQKANKLLPNYIENIVLQGKSVNRFYIIEKENVNVFFITVESSPKTILDHQMEYYEIIGERLIKSNPGFSKADFHKVHSNLVFRKISDLQ